MKTKSSVLLLSALLCSSPALVSGATTMSENLLAYWDFTSPAVEQTTPPNTTAALIAPTYSKDGKLVSANIYKPGTSNSTHSTSGGAFGGGYITTNSQGSGTGKNFHIYGGLAGMSTSEDKGFAVSMQTKADSKGQVSFSFNFSGNADDSTFLITGSAISVGGLKSNVWTVTPGFGTLSADNWTSLVLSVDNNGVANIYVGGLLLATTEGSGFNMFGDAWNGASRWNGNMSKFGLGGKIEGPYQATSSSFSDLTMWDTSLSAEDAAFLANNPGYLLGSVPEPGAAALSLLGAGMFLFRRKIRD